MDLVEYISAHHSAIIAEWATFAGTLGALTGGMSDHALRDHAEEILTAIVEDLAAPQETGEQVDKSQGHGAEHRMQTVGKLHAAARIADGFKLDQLVSEYRALRASVLRLYAEAGGTDLRQVTRFNEAVDEALVESTNRYMQLMDRTRDQFLAVLGHDLRNPLGAILTSAAVLASRGADDRTIKVAGRILSSAQRMKRLVNDLLDLTRTRLGSGIPIVPQSMDLGDLVHEVLAELQAFHPDRRFDLHSKGDLRGVWDTDRLAQVLSNLLGNALQHGTPNTPVGVVARVDAEEVVVDIHNEGPTIPPALLDDIFEPLVRTVSEGKSQPATSLGLGLHIARQIVLSHGGTVTVTSTDRAGTTFSVRLPRRTAPSPSHHSG